MTTHPTDKELEAFAIEEQFLLFCDEDEFTQIASAVLAKWGAPAQAIPAAVAGCTRSHPHENMDSACRAKAAIAEMQNMAARGAEATTHDLERFVAMLAAAPTTQPAPQQEAASVDLKTMELAESVGLIGPASRTNDLHAAIQRFHDLICANATIKAAQMAAEAISEAAPQQEVQEPVAWYVTGCGRLLDEDEAKAEARRIGGTARAIPLYTAPQADSALKDHHIAALVNELRDIAAEFHGTQQLRERIAHAVVPVLKAKAADGVLEDADPLQGAANWLAEAHGQFCVAVLQGCLMIGYNRAKRLHDAAIAARKQGANHD